MEKNNLERIDSSINKIMNNSNVIYFLTYDTKNNARASVKHIYDMALSLRESGVDAKILVEDKTYSGVKSWLGDVYDEIPVVSIKEDNVQIYVEDILVVPEYYSNVLQQLSSIKAVKVMLVQQKDYIFETLSIGSRWSDFGFDRCITTSEKTKKYILEYFPETLVYVIPPYIGENFSPSTKMKKPYISISCRDRNINRRIISEFYLKYPHLRWITFRDMVQLSYEEFSEALKECMVSVWVDDESTFGTFPLESMKCDVPVIGKLPNTEPEWLTNNGMWTDNVNNITEILGTYVLAWIEGGELKDEIKETMKNSYLPFNKDFLKQKTKSVFESLISNRLETLKKIKEKTTNE